MAKHKGRPALDPSRKAVNLTITITPAMAAALDREENKSETVRQALAAWLAKREGVKRWVMKP